MYKDIIECELTFPDYVEKEEIDLMRGLLNKDQMERKKFVKGIKRHPWLKGVTWKAYLKKEVTPPWLPDIDQSNFDPEYTSLPLDFDF